MSAVLDELLRLLDLETLDLNLFRGQSRDDGFRNLYGGQVVAQALVAACRTVPADRPPQSLHAYFLRPGNLRQPLIFEVERIRDGGSFTTRRVQAIQNSEPIFSMMVSFHVAESAWDHQAAMPRAPAPEGLESGLALHERWLAGDRRESPGMVPLQAVAQKAGIEFRPVLAAQSGLGAAPARQQLWFRCAQALPAAQRDDQNLHACLLAYASDFCLLGTAKLPHGGYFGQQDMMMASLDHAIWFHRPLRVDDWLLYTMESTTAAGAGGFARGQIFDRAGRLVASVTQEGLMRQLAPRPG